VCLWDSAKLDIKVLLRGKLPDVHWFYIILKMGESIEGKRMTGRIHSDISPNRSIRLRSDNSDGRFVKTKMLPIAEECCSGDELSYQKCALE
jgi:hypothetical protein